MNVRRLLTAPAVSLLVLTAAVAPAGADTVYTATIPATMHVVSDTCATTASGSVTIVEGPPVAGRMGSGSLDLHQGEVHDVVGIGRDLDLVSHLDSISFWMHDPDHSDSPTLGTATWIDVRVTLPSGTYHLLKWVNGDVGWQSVAMDATTGLAVVKEVDGGGWSQPTFESIQQFVTMTGDGPAVAQVLRAPCYRGKVLGDPAGWAPPAGLGRDTWLDAVRITATGETPTAYDFEPATQVVAMATPATTITAGGSATILGTVTDHGTLAPGVAVDLLARPWNSATWSRAGSAVSNRLGQLVLTVAPRRATDYRWSPPAPIPDSQKTRVNVRTALPLAVADATLRAGQTLVVTGRTVPARPGATVTLRRRTSSGAVALATGVVSATGTFRITKVLRTTGTWKVLVTIPAGDGTLAGTSVARTVTVS
jgi:hypothetical protein